MRFTLIIVRIDLRPRVFDSCVDVNRLGRLLKAKDIYLLARRRAYAELAFWGLSHSKQGDSPYIKLRMAPMLVSY